MKAYLNCIISTVTRISPYFSALRFFIRLGVPDVVENILADMVRDNDVNKLLHTHGVNYCKST